MQTTVLSGKETDCISEWYVLLPQYHAPLRGSGLSSSDLDNAESFQGLGFRV
jgi:hypothetical protein